MLNKQRDVENAVRAVLREVGLKLGTPSRKLFAARTRELTSVDAAISDIIEPLLAVLETIARQIERLTKHVLDAAKVEPICRRLMTVPSVGPLTALTFRATVDRPERFRRSRDVGAHLGLTPRRYQSGETDIQGRISQCGDKLARTALYEAAHTLLTRCQEWSRSKPGDAHRSTPRHSQGHVAVARKLAVILHRIQSDATKSRWGVAPALAAA
jgi:transposase